MTGRFSKWDLAGSVGFRRFLMRRAGITRNSASDPRPKSSRRAALPLFLALEIFLRSSLPVFEQLAVREGYFKGLRRKNVESGPSDWTEKKGGCGIAARRPKVTAGSARVCRDQAGRFNCPPSVLTVSESVHNWSVWVRDAFGNGPRERESFIAFLLFFGGRAAVSAFSETREPCGDSD